MAGALVRLIPLGNLGLGIELESVCTVYWSFLPAQCNVMFNKETLGNMIYWTKFTPFFI